MEKYFVIDVPLTPPGVKGVTWRRLASISFCLVLRIMIERAQYPSSARQAKNQAHAMHARSSKTDYPGPPSSRSSGWPGLLLVVALLDVPRSPALKSEASSFLIYILACLIFHILATLVQYIFYALLSDCLRCSEYFLAVPDTCPEGAHQFLAKS
jgi:hypothetical protein